jgi:hypothetical protein
MPQYRFFLVNEHGRPARGTAFPFRNDDAAIEFARLAAKDRPAELWSGERLIWRQPPDEPSN